MKYHKLLLMILIAAGIACLAREAMAQVPDQPSIVTVKGRQLIVQKRLEDGSLEPARPYIIKGVTWSAATRAPEDGPNPDAQTKNVPYGFFFDWPGRIPQGHVIFRYWLTQEYYNNYVKDIKLMHDMNVNTIRAYSDFSDNPAMYKPILDEFYKNGIMVIMCVAIAKDELDSQRYLRIVEGCKDHPAILMWYIGNEWNMEFNKYYGYNTVRECAKATNNAAKDIKKMDRNHPVSSCLGDRFFDKERSNTVGWIVKACPEISVWGLNIYRGQSFGEFFKQWKKVTNKPFYFAEFGSDSFMTTNYEVANGFQAKNCEGHEDQKMQADHAIKLWREIEYNLSAVNPKNSCVGGLIHSFNDSLWKVGSYHVQLGGIINYNDPVQGRSYATYNPEGFYMKDGFVDSVANEEYFGVVDADRKPKEVYYSLQRYYKSLELSR